MVGGLLAAVALSSCSGNGQNPQKVTTVNPLQGKLQLAVGTANIFGDLGAGGGALTGLNVVATFRQPAGAQTPGDTDALVNTPTLSGPFTLPTAAGTPDAYGSTIGTGPGPGETGGARVTATPQQNPGSSTIPASTFGVSGGVTGLGIEPFNYTTTGTAGTVGTPTTFKPYIVPAYDNGDANAFRPWGGPPAFDPNKDGKGERDGTAVSTTILGVSEGLDVFAGVAPAVGSYSLSVNVPTSQNGTSGNVSTSASLGSGALLPAVTPPVAAPDGTGGATLAVTLPAGVTEAYVQITDFGLPENPDGSQNGNCNSAGDGGPGNNPPIYYTLFVTASGTATLPPNDGPGTPGTTTPSICTPTQNTTASGSTTPSVGDQFTTQLIGFDYPAYQASYPNSNGNPAPTLLGAAGQADITISSAMSFMQPVGTAAIRVKSFAFLKRVSATSARLRH
ncbi:MAG: hypothetical protein GIX03_12940 [Candidatus Eremiobacteraeota bacterium]|nr:hypothetical protein [Candidatus Eremiobacteraeota bacterium]MBC5803871.1 hypothetical protein [Candidatus Eremiobacteraeota bacterium]MBC5822972.1 hypothetical protein [Candidatus Eremiobacteraeota bacterium]